MAKEKQANWVNKGRAKKSSGKRQEELTVGMIYTLKLDPTIKAVF